jgi:hypothetical protein
MPLRILAIMDSVIGAVDAGAGDKWRSGVEAPGRCAYSTPVRVKNQLMPAQIRSANRL